MTELLNDEELQARLEQLQSPNGQRKYKYVTPFSAAATSLVDVLSNTDHRFKLGLPHIDVMTRGFGKHELALIVGFAHSGKTQLINTMILNNPEKRVLFFSLDDPAEMILTKLICMKEGFSAEFLEQWVRESPKDARLNIERHARNTFKNLLVPDANLSIGQMDEAIAEATDLWGNYPDAIVIDYLQLIPGEEGETGTDHTKSMSRAIKRWVKDLDCPLIVLHQNNRAKGGPGEVVSMLSAAYGGEQEATFMLGVRRKLFDESLDEHDRMKHADTVTLHLVKNKRPPGRLTPPQGHDFHIDGKTGLIRQLTPADFEPSSKVASQWDNRGDQQVLYRRDIDG